MLRLLDKSKGVPDHFRYTHAESGFVSTGVNWWDMWDSVVKHRTANGYSPITEAEAEDQLCRQLGPNFCQQEQPGDFRFVSTRLRFGDIVQGMKGYLSLIASGFQTVPQEEANRRAAICGSCYLRVTPQGCGACVKLSQMITGDLAQKTTPYDSLLVNKACAACHCGVQSIVHFPMSILENAESKLDHDLQERFAPFCWRKRSSENYQPDAP